MEITHLVVAGCSWTYCQGLADPKTQGWPALVAKELGIPVVNLARPGIGNDAIHRRTYEYAFEDSSDNNPFYIVVWTQTWRREAWCRHLYDGRANGYSIIAMPGDVPQNNIERALLDTWNEEDFYRRLVLYRLSLDSLFKSKNIEYMTSFFADEEFNHGSNDCVDEIQNVKNRFNNTVDYLSKNTNRLDSFMDIAGPYPKTKCGHEGVEGNQVIANYIIKMMNEKYQKIIPVNKDFLTLKSYYLKTDPYEKSNQHWI
jgi:hypothetical protein